MVAKDTVLEPQSLIRSQHVAVSMHFDWMIDWACLLVNGRHYQSVYCGRVSSRVLPAGNLQSSLSQSQWRHRHQISDVRSYASWSLYRRR